MAKFSASGLRRWLRHELRYRPRGRWHKRLLDRSWIQLSALFVVGYLLVALAFGALYRHFQCVYESNVTDPKKFVTDWGDLLYYSVIVQTSVGFGDLTARAPHGRLITVLHALVGSLLNAIGLGLIFFKLIQRQPSLIFSPVVCYDPATHQLVVWVWNRDAYSLYDLKYTIGFTKVVDDEPGVWLRRYQLKIAKLHTFIWPMFTLFIKTASPVGADPSRPPTAKGPRVNRVTICSRTENQSPLFGPDGRLHVELRAYAVETGNEFFATKVYEFDQIRCGQFKALEPRTIDWRKRNFEVFGQIDETQPAHCSGCSCLEACPLEPARLYRVGLLELARPEHFHDS